MVKFYEKGHFIAQIGTKMDNKQQKHDLVNCPLFLKKAANHPEIGIFEKVTGLPQVNVLERKDVKAKQN